MAPNARPSLPLTVQPSSGKGRSSTVFTSAALGLAAAFHRDFSCCDNDPQRRKVCQKYRDKILSISKFADATAAAFHDAFPQSLRESDRGEDARAWTYFDSLVQRQRKTQNRGAQLLQLQTSVVAIWGNDVFKHYGWRELPLDSAKLLHSVASKLPDWNFAVKVINNALIERHERRIVKHDNRAQRIGEHSRGSKIQDPYSPVEPRDLETVLSRVKDGKLQISPQGEHEMPMYTIDGTPIREHGLRPDKFSMIVPDDIPGLERESASPSRQANKRRRLDRNDYESSAEPEGFQPPTSWDRVTTASASRSDSEMTEFEEESCSGSVSANTGYGLQIPEDQSEMQNNVDECRIQTPEASAGKTQDSSTPFLLQNICASQDTAPNPKSPRPQANSTLVEMRAGNDEGCAQVSVTGSEPLPLHGSAKSSDRESRLHGENGSPETGLPKGVPREDSAILNEESEQSLPVSGDRTCEAIIIGEDHQLCPLQEQNLPVLPPTKSVVSDHQGDMPGEDNEAENESEPEFANPDDIAALETIASMGFDPSQRLGDRSVHQSMSESSASGSQALSLPTANGVLIAAVAEMVKKQYCTNTNVDDDVTIVGRMASHHAARLREILNAAQMHHDDHSAQGHNRTKVKWLERTEWASVYAVPNDLESTSQLPLDVDVWYMNWETFQQRADGGEVFLKPIIIKQKFQDSGMYDPHDFIALLRERYPNQKLDVQNRETGECVSKSTTDLFSTTIECEGSETKELRTFDNAINLRRIANADAPLLTRMKRFRLLETLVDRVSNLAPGKRTCRETHDISDCLGFNLLGFPGSFSRPHVDSLVGTWIRCLSGSKAWIFAPGMSDRDWDDFAQDGVEWSPGDKARAIILEKDDILLMPPGLRVLHTVFTVETSLMEGGMLWDEYNIPQLLDELLWVGQNQSCTNEAIAYQLPRIIDSLEVWIHENSARLSANGNKPGFITSAKQGIQNLRTLGCKCSHRCDKDSRCLCSTRRRRCTSWCSKHPAFPDRAAGQARQCMHEK